MAAWQIPLEAAHAAPGPNAFDYAMRGQQSALTAQAMMQQQQAQQQEQQLRAQQIEGAQLQNEQTQIAMQNQAALNRAWQAGWGANPGQTQPQAPAQPVAASAPGATAQPEPGFFSPSGDWVANPAAGSPPPPAPANGAQSVMAAAAGPQGAAAPQAAPPAPAHPMASHVAGAPLPTFNFNAVVDSLVRSGHGALVPGMMQGNTELLTKQAALLKDQTANHTALAAQATQLIQAIPQIHGDSPEETQQLRDRAYQRILPQLTDIERKMDPNSQLPATWDDQTGQQMIANGTTVTDFNNRQHQTAALALQMQENAPKSAAEAESQINHSAGNTTSQQQLDDVRGRYQALADYEKKVNPNGVSFYALALKNLPIQWSPDVALQAQVDQMKPEDVPKFFQSRIETASDRMKAAALEGRAAYAYELASTDPLERSLFLPPGANFDPQKMSTAAAKVGESASQQITAESLGQYRKELAAWRNKSLDHKISASGTGGKIVANLAFENGGNDYDKATDWIKNSDDPYVQSNALAAVTVLNRAKATGLRPDQIQGQIDKAASDQATQDLVKSLMGTPAGAPAPKAAAPVRPGQVPAPAQPKAAPAAQARPQQTPAQQPVLRYRNAAGQVIHWDGKSWVDEATGKPMQ